MSADYQQITDGCMQEYASARQLPEDCPASMSTRRYISSQETDNQEVRIFSLGSGLKSVFREFLINKDKYGYHFPCCVMMP